ncbi:MAG: quinolinate synthase NadA [Chlorobiaceae bacterium]|nr:quinolinate synthase NadA [Chlorobiaceae bacterium]
MIHRPVHETEERIRALKKTRDAVIIAHHYAPAETHAIADVLSDSRGFFSALQQGVDAKVVVVIGPSFFAEITAAMLPEKTVLLPIHSECPVAHHRNLSFDKIAEFKELHHGIPLVCYATSPLKTKLLADYVALPGEVVQTINAIDAHEVLFVGEENCAEDAVRKCKKKVHVYPNNPVCNVYNSANIADFDYLKSQYPESCVMVHPECKPEITQVADYVIGTGEMRRLIQENPERNCYILGTEIGFFHRMQREFPEKHFVHLSPYLTCNVFKVFRIETILDALENMKHVVQVDRVISERISFLFQRLVSMPAN